MYKHILIPTDGSPASERAIAAGVKLAKSLGARVTGFHAAPSAKPVMFGRTSAKLYMPAGARATAIARATSRYLAAIERAAAAASVECDTVSVTTDFPAEAILDAVRRRKCDLVFMASHGRHGLAGVLLGSQTQKVLTHSKVAVLVHR